jgi:hypothetical protein
MKFRFFFLRHDLYIQCAGGCVPLTLALRVLACPFKKLILVLVLLFFFSQLAWRIHAENRTRMEGLWRTLRHIFALKV